MGSATRIAENLGVVRERIARAAERAARRPDEIRLVVVTKTQPLEAVQEAVAAGAREIGESYVQEAEAKLDKVPPEVTRHLIGHLQKNKAGKAALLFDMVQSVDGADLARALGRRAVAAGRALDVLIEVNVAEDPAKYGAAPEKALEIAAEVAAVPGLRLHGLMGIGVFDDEAATARCFRRLAGLFRELPAEHRQVLSMGMTADFELAIAEGSTMVRVGTAIFGPRGS